MIRFKKSKMILFLVCVFSIFITKVKADIRCFKVPQNKSLLLSNSSKYSPDLKWKTADKSIANVNEYGIVTGVSQGKTEIKMTNLKNSTVTGYDIEIIEEEPIRTFGVSSNLVASNENFQAEVFTPKNAVAVKFLVTGKNYKREFVVNKKEKEQRGSFLWKKDLKIQPEGIYKIEVFSKINNQWKTCSEGTCGVKILKKYNAENTFLGEKRVSRKCENFIKSFEGFVPNVYKDIAGYFTIGYGKLLLPYDAFYDNVSKEESNLIFLKSLNKNFSTPLNKFLLNNKIKCSQNQFDALLSFTYNLGIGWLSSKNKIKSTILDSQTVNTAILGKVTSSNGIYLRKTPDTTLKPTGVLRCGDVVTILSEEKVNEKWYKVSTELGKTGFCCADYLKLNTVNTSEIDLDKIDSEEFVNYFSKYHNAGRKCFILLLKRRFCELDIFFKGKYISVSDCKLSNFDYAIPDCMKNKI